MLKDDNFFDFAVNLLQTRLQEGHADFFFFRKSGNKTSDGENVIPIHRKVTEVTFR
jgi:hypothetical protein